MADLLELNVSCPMPALTVGMHIGKSAELTYVQVKTAKSVARIPFTVKLTPNVSDMCEIAKAAEEAGADGLTISNSIRSFAGVDIETGHPYLRGYGGYTWPAIRPIILRHLTETAKTVSIPISAVGGVSNFRDVIEYSFDEIRGIALPEITTVEKLAEEPALTAVINAQKCVGCGICEKHCFYRAIEQDKNGMFTADRTKCDACGLCAQFCPKDAIRLE